MDCGNLIALNYPSSGSSAMLPLTTSDRFKHVEILVCHGAPDNAFSSANAGDFLTALRSCGRIVIVDSKPGWAMENIPAPRVMGDMLILPTGDILIVNSAQSGLAGWELGENPTLAPFLYIPNSSPDDQFSTLTASTIPRMYHSTASVLPDGRILVGGSNPHVGYVLSGTAYSTELRLEAYNPYYLDGAYQIYRPTIAALSSSLVNYGKTVTIQFTVSNYTPQNIGFHLYAPSFTTHSFSMNQRMLILASNCTKPVRGTYYDVVMAPPNSLNQRMLVLASSSPNLVRGTYSEVVTATPNSVIALAGYYMLFVVNNGIPSVGK